MAKANGKISALLLQAGISRNKKKKTQALT